MEIAKRGLPTYLSIWRSPGRVDRGKQPEPRMLKAFLRLLSMIALSVAVIMAIIDATRSIAAEAVVLTPLGMSWAGLSPASLEQFRMFVLESLPDFVWNRMIAAFLDLPGFAVFALLALLLAIVGRRTARREAAFRTVR